MSGAAFLAVVFQTLSISTPQDGAVVPTLKEGQKAYFAGSCAERLTRLDNAPDRAKLFSMGAVQKPVKLTWSGPTNAVYELTISVEGGEEECFSLTNRTQAYVTNLELGRRYGWMVREVGTGESASASFLTEPDGPRFLRADGVFNFRDLGGWKTASGKTVRENMIFRSSGLRASSRNRGSLFRKNIELGERRVTDGGIATLREDFRIRTDLELRSSSESTGMGDTVLGAGVRWVKEPFVAYEAVDNVIRGREPFAKIFSLFTKGENYPILMHCADGQDITGTLAFLLNGLLGVGEDDLCRDWEASVFSNPGTTCSPARLRGFLKYLNGFPGRTVQERIVAYAHGCGITDAEIDAFRAIMLR